MNAVPLYFRYIGISVRAQLQYRKSTALQIVGQFLITGAEFIAVWGLFARFGNIRGWGLPETALFYGVISMTFAISDAFARGFDLFGTIVKSGDFDRMLLRPRSTVLQLMGQELTVRRMGRFFQGFIVFAWAAFTLNLEWSIGGITLLLFAMLGGVCLFTGLVILSATSAFWTTESLEVWNAFTYGGVAMSQYPLTIYRPWFRQFFTFVIPLACVNYFPIVAILDRPDPLGSPWMLQWLSPAAGLLFLLLALRLWRFGVRHYCSTGS